MRQNATPPGGRGGPLSRGTGAGLPLDLLRPTVLCLARCPAQPVESPAPRPRRHETERAARAVAARFSRRAPPDWAALDYMWRRRCAADEWSTPKRGGFFVVRRQDGLEGHSSAFLDEARGKEPFRPSVALWCLCGGFKAESRRGLSSLFPPPASFGSVVAVRSRGCRPFGFLPGDRLWVFGHRVADRSRGCWRW